MIGSAKIVCLVENRTGDPSLRAEHGLSLWLDLDGTRIIFDTGLSDACCFNARMLGIDVTQAHAIVLSHGHYDHTGGLSAVRKLAPDARLFLHPAALNPKYSRAWFRKSRGIGIPSPSAKELKGAGNKVVFTQGPTEISPDVTVTGFIPRHSDFEDVGGQFFGDADGSLPDLLPDDQALFFTTGSGPVVVLGCAHAGVVNTLEYVTTLLGTDRVHCVLGGMHLRSASENRLKKTAEGIRRFGVRQMFPAHCTGEKAEQYFARELAIPCRPMTTGMTLRIEGTDVIIS